MSEDTSETFDQILAKERAAIEAEKQTDEERVRREEEKERDEREQNLRRAAALNYDALYECFAGVEITSQVATDAALNTINNATAVLRGEQSTSVPTPTAASNIPFDWDRLDSDQQNAILLIAENKRRFYVKPSGALGDKRGRELDQAHRATNQPVAPAEESARSASDTTSETVAPTPEPEPTPPPASSPADMPTRKAPAKKTAAVPAQPSESAQPSEAEQPSDDGTDETSTEPKKQSFKDRAKEAAGKAKESGKNLVKKLD